MVQGRQFYQGWIAIKRGTKNTADLSWWTARCHFTLEFLWQEFSCDSLRLPRRGDVRALSPSLATLHPITFQVLPLQILSVGSLRDGYVRSRQRI